MENTVLSFNNNNYSVPLRPKKNSNPNAYFESESDTPLIINTYHKKTPSFCSQLFFSWTKLAMKISNKKSLKIHHLTDHDKTEYIKPLYSKLYSTWYFPTSTHTSLSKKSGLCPLFTALIITNLKSVLLVICLSILLTIVKLMQIYYQRKLVFLFKISTTTSTTGVHNVNTPFMFHFEFMNSIPVTACMFLINKIIQIFLNHHTTNFSQTVGIKAGNMLSGLLYEKLMRSAIFLKNKVSEGEILNCIQNDVDTLGFVFFYAPMTVVVPFQFAAYIYMLFSYFGATFIFGFLIFLILFTVAWVIQRMYIANQRLLLKNKDQRLKITSNTLHIIKVLKLYAWENEFINRIDKTREKELNSLKKIQNVYVLSGFVHWSIPLFVSVCSIGIYTLIHGEMPIENLLTSIEIFDSMSTPLYRLPIFITSLLNCLISMKRCEKFLYERDIESSSKQDSALRRQNIDVKFTNCNFGIKQYRNCQHKILLNDINIEIHHGDLVAVLGETGSGKTNLANAIVNYLEYIPNKDISKEQTAVNVINGDVSYAPQNPWIMNESIRNNILFYNVMDAQRYNEIIDICQLRSDLDNLPGGEYTEVSSNGTNISGGQKARISLARAIYKQANIYLLDDPISSVDVINATEIFNKVLLNYLKGKTRILFKHDIRNLHRMDKIIYMNKGKVIWSGTYDEFTKHKLYMELLSRVHKKTNTQEQENKRFIASRKLSYKDIIERKFNINDIEEEKKQKGKLIKEEYQKQGKIQSVLYVKFIQLMGGYAFFTLLIFLALANQSTQIFSNIWLMHWSSTKGDNLYMFLIYAEIGLFSLFSLFLKEFLFSRSFLNVNRTLHNQMLHKIIYAPINLFHDIVPIGQIINRLTSDLDKCKIILKLYSHILQACAALIGSVYVCASFNIYSLLSAPLMLVVGFYITYYYINAGRDLNRLDGISRTPIVTCFSETISGAPAIKAFKTQYYFKERFFKLLNNYYLVSSFKFGSANWYSLHLDFSSYLYSFFIIIFACVFRESVTAQAIGLLLKYSISFSEQMLNSFNEISNMEKSMVSYERCDEYTHIIQEKQITNQKDSALRKWPESGHIRMVNYTTRYRQETEIALNDINIEIKPGEKVGIVGRSGSGKSTLSLAVYRIIEPMSGNIYIDGIDITTIGLRKLRESMCIVPQDPTLIEGTLRDNVDPLGKYTDDEIIQVLEELDFFGVMKSNKRNNSSSAVTNVRNLHFKIKEFGNNMSLGEKQLVCFARAILKRAKIIFLDEATASLDQRTEDIIQKAIEKYFKECTVLTIAHRVQTIKKCDKILVLDKGKVVEFDKPEVLLQNATGLFYKLYYKGLQNVDE